MFKVWFLLALITTPNHTTIKYHGVGAYDTIEACQKHQIQYENFLIENELRFGNRAVWVESYCMPFHTFKRNGDV